MGLPKDRTLTETQMRAMPDPPIAVVFYNSTTHQYVTHNGNNWGEVQNIPLWNHILAENFENGLPTWMNTVDDSNNAFVIGTGEFYEGTKSLYTSNDSGVSSNYTKYEINHIYFDVVLPSGLQKWRLRSKWKCEGETGDYARVFIDPSAAVVPIAGSFPSLTIIGENKYRNQSIWKEDFIELDNTYAGTTVRIIVSFRADNDSTINPPALCLDDFFVEYI